MLNVNNVNKATVLSQLPQNNSNEAVYGGRKSPNGTTHLFLDPSNQLAVTFPYNEQYISELKKIPRHRWHAKEKQWSFPLDRESAKKIMKIFENEEVEIAPELKFKLQILDESVEKDLQELRQLMRLKNYSNKTMKAYLSCIRIFAKYGSSRIIVGN